MALTYRYMYERRAIRLVTRSESKEYIINFKNQRHKDKALKCILRLAGSHLDPQLQRLESANDSLHENEVAQQTLAEFTAKWQTGMFSNAEYLMLLNFASCRSFNDASQYPVFPWVITDYKNDRFPEE